MIRLVPKGKHLSVGPFKRDYALKQWFSKCGARNSSIITWKLVRNTKSPAPSRPTEIEPLGLEPSTLFYQVV